MQLLLPSLEQREALCVCGKLLGKHRLQIGTLKCFAKDYWSRGKNDYYPVVSCFFFPEVSYGPCFLGLEVASLTCFLLVVLISFSRRYASFPRISLMHSNWGGGSQRVIKKNLVNKVLSWFFVLQKSKIAEVTYMIASNAPEVDRASSLFSLLDQLIADCR